MELDDASILKIQRNDGLHLTLSATNVACKYFYITEQVEKGGDTEPALKFNNPVSSYQKLLEVVQEAFREVLLDLYRDGPRKVLRIGVVADGSIDREAPPPGVESFIDYIGALWGTNAQGISVNGTITARLMENDDCAERCLHSIKNAGIPGAGVPLRLDWQRVIKQGRSGNVNKVCADLDECVRAATSYFDRFGLGDLEYGS